MRVGVGVIVDTRVSWTRPMTILFGYERLYRIIVSTLNMNMTTQPSLKDQTIECMNLSRTEQWNVSLVQRQANF